MHCQPGNSPKQRKGNFYSVPSYVCVYFPSGPLCSSSQSSSWGPMSPTHLQAMGRNRPLRLWWAAWMDTPAAIVPPCECKPHARTCPRSSSTAKKSSRISPIWCESSSFSSTSLLDSSPHASSTTEEESLRAR